MQGGAPAVPASSNNFGRRFNGSTLGILMSCSQVCLRLHGEILRSKPGAQTCDQAEVLQKEKQELLVLVKLCSRTSSSRDTSKYFKAPHQQLEFGLQTVMRAVSSRQQGQSQGLVIIGGFSTPAAEAPQPGKTSTPDPPSVCSSCSLQHKRVFFSVFFHLYMRKIDPEREC